jgi:cytoplasmic iron level regulating protein YaaA (DUF328/UPF0246 family)
MIKAVAQLGQQPRVSKRLLGVKGIALEKAMADNASVAGSPTMAAIERYTGVMYDAIDYRSLDSQSRDAFDKSVVIMSGLFGMVRPSDMIPNYKLTMSAPLLHRKPCSAVWKPLITKTLAVESGVIWDLLPIEHSAAWDPEKVPCQTRFRFKFLQVGKDGQTNTVSHLSKALKGSLVRHLVCNATAANSPESALELIASFEHPEGYEYRSELTSEIAGATEIVFLK